jgi:nucleotidyltransferase/DNA polymerase involved in DNA repair
MLAKIGNAPDGYDNGLLSSVNALAKDQGVELNMSVNEAVKLCQSTSY